MIIIIICIINFRGPFSCILDTLGTEAIRAFFTVQCCWLNNEEIYLEKGCLHCGSPATYLIYYTNPHIQKLMLAFIKKYHCVLSREQDLLDLPDLKMTTTPSYKLLSTKYNFYARLHHDIIRPFAFETVDSIFERRYALAC